MKIEKIENIERKSILLEAEGDFETAQRRFKNGDYSYYKAYNDEDLGYEIIDSYGELNVWIKKH